MNASSLRRLALFVAVIIVLAFLSQGLAERLFINPLVSGIWILQPFIAILHMLLWWGVLLPAALILAYHSLRIKRDPRLDPEENGGKPGSRIENWASWLNNNDESDYFRGNVARQLGELTLQVMGQKERLEPDEAREKLRLGGFDLPEDVRSYLEWGYNHRSRPSPTSLQQRVAELMGEKEDTFDIEKLVEFLEQQLEISELPANSQ